MAKFAFKATDDYAIRLSKMAAESEEVAKKAIFAAAEIVADQIKSNLQGVLSDEATGELVDSFGVTPITRDNLGNWNVKIGFDDYDSNGVANQLKARVIESGSSTKKKKPFVRPAVNATKKKAQAEMDRIIDEEYKKLMG
ncbi:MAG: HK97 gp10 family phage protein [Gudongella sp.]|nr:HK97 gp10 family phage protein [Gudongella sp.]